jgi:AcrR family transcriptional regulator
MHFEQVDKFLALDPEKRERIINAGMNEFLNGFKKASTDVIVRAAGISKGLLFHYFGTKENLYDFLIDYAINTVQAEYLDLLNVNQTDIFESIWQMSLLKRDVSLRFPMIFDFLIRVYLDQKDCPAKEHLKRFQEMQAQRFSIIYSNCDKSLFRDDVDPEKVVSIVQWALHGWAETKTSAITHGNVNEVMENYDTYLDEMKEYLNIFKQCFYKPQ